MFIQCVVLAKELVGMKGIISSTPWLHQPNPSFRLQGGRTGSSLLPRQQASEERCVVVAKELVGMKGIISSTPWLHQPNPSFRLQGGRTGSSLLPRQQASEERVREAEDYRPKQTAFPKL
ncbi:unnamed protein product [Toxocara canis]|uniref:Uncharacterized protein n=1 Tax=Toxocara canis TaxID=6265 RepID=A0A183VE27_TOXCA|nr:unnamed protein product [Toxocara canis]